MIKAIESFNNDVGRYPLSDTSNVIRCYIMANGVVTDPSAPCNGKIFVLTDGVNTTYMNIPSDPVTSQNYPYVSAGGTEFAFYAALENTNDKDILRDAQNNIITYPEVSCGSVPCNYKVTEDGLTKSI
ncbi:MAG: hypothetical protein UW64_C0001G0037 [Microgenomates group bacterium GW2011_GWC1_44_37]|uniref:Uncharacterized protein n=1 Tax=Candidatus Collierbacteria bacterium GW2011_GWB2_44_22 TaxID=1618387 RepID=A0A0G1K6Q3_9BACT|nr:MAG: hypothetical protein UW31_C0009G0015 [Candidatus Collierbacteria bacterium GW2011_GWA2_44_13]KKT51535.1 MAG: hypothetical protein UW42_C0001G0010 [Candidatus Collierbacteria bacterium GW2011_GWB1_44_197]KKT52012.1 MAG: hypothetical protein UW44_C0005G0054 [Candidatus Collierbacteria bacterium GW2011_GWB2_44_22]KKT62130.1 MAG: hypothetical protein UW56_C0011G0015 [Candidatus Collierbacteria bacterium GW2011_GWD1_44_27]KKT69391.1 MAG: hypothetical protein UW64_C0001G0037 [Microgenomates g